MAATKANIGYGAIFSIDGVPVAECKTVKTSLFTVPSIDATHLLSPDSTEEKIPGILKPGTAELGGNFIGDASQLNIQTLARAFTVFPFTITAPINSRTQTYTVSGNGFISKYDTGPFEISKLIEFMATIEITGTITETVA
jgi:hypothetical protein